MRKLMIRIGLLILLVTVAAACVSHAGIGKLAGNSWKEEVELHNGTNLLVTRTQSYKGRHEIGQAVPVGEHTVSFTLPSTGESYSWTSEYGEELGRTNFKLLAIHVLDNTPYIIAEPNLCLSYNKWGRPNPPYVIYKHTENAWKRIPIEELPPEFKTLNVLINIRPEDIRGISSMRTISAATIKTRNAELRKPEHRTILREPGQNVGCEVMVRYKCGWGSPGEFNRKYFERVCK